MANLLVMIEFAGDRPHPGSLEALGQARRLGSALGATVYAVTPLPAAPGCHDEDVIAVLSRHGADKVILGAADYFAEPARWATVGPLLLSVCATAPPLLLLLTATPAGRDVGARAAAHLGAAYLADGWIELERAADGATTLALFDGSGADARRLDGDLEFPVVALVPPGRYGLALGEDEAEVEIVGVPLPAPGEFVALPVDPALGGRGARLLGCDDAALSASLSAMFAPPRDPDTDDPGLPARVAVAVLPSQRSADEARAWRGADTRIALGSGAAACADAVYSVEGEGPLLVEQLGQQLAALAATPHPVPTRRRTPTPPPPPPAGPVAAATPTAPVTPPAAAPPAAAPLAPASPLNATPASAAPASGPGSPAEEPRADPRAPDEGR